MVYRPRTSETQLLTPGASQDRIPSSETNGGMTRFRSLYLVVVFHCVCGVGGGRGDVFFIPLSVDGHLGCSHVLAMVNNAAVTVGGHVSS